MKDSLTNHIFLHIIHITGHPEEDLVLSLYSSECDIEYLRINLPLRQLMTLPWLHIMQRKLFLQLLLPPDCPLTALYGDMTIRQ